MFVRLLNNYLIRPAEKKEYLIVFDSKEGLILKLERPNGF